MSRLSLNWQNSLNFFFSLKLPSPARCDLEQSLNSGGQGTSGLEGEFQSGSEVDFYIDRNMIHIADTKVHIWITKCHFFTVVSLFSSSQKNYTGILAKLLLARSFINLFWLNSQWILTLLHFEELIVPLKFFEGHIRSLLPLKSAFS